VILINSGVIEILDSPASNIIYPLISRVDDDAAIRFKLDRLVTIRCAPPNDDMIRVVGSENADSVMRKKICGQAESGNSFPLVRTTARASPIMWTAALAPVAQMAIVAYEDRGSVTRKCRALRGKKCRRPA